MSKLTKQLKHILGLGLISVLAACGGTTDNTLPKDEDADLNGTPLSVSITASTETTKTGEDVTLTATTKGDGADTGTVTWSANGGTLSPDTGLEVTWTAPATEGTYTITATLEANGETTTASQEITVTTPDGEDAPPEPLTLTITASTETTNTGENVTLTATTKGDGADTGTVTWSANGGTLSPDAGLEVTWTAPATEGTYTITATLEANGETTTASQEITVTTPDGEDAPPEPLTLTITASAETTNTGENVTLTATTKGDGADTGTITWSANGGTLSPDTGLEVTWTAPATEGTYTITATLEANGETVADSIKIEVTDAGGNEEPEPLTITVDAETGAVYGQEVTLTATVEGDGASEATVTWTAEDDAGEFSALEGLSTVWRAPSASGPVEITATVSGENLSDTVTIDVTLCNDGATDNASDPCIITNVHQLQAINEDLSGHFRLGSDIDASQTEHWNSGAGFAPINTGFTGSLDGAGFAIQNLHIHRPASSRVALFSLISPSGTVTNLTLEEAVITGLSQTAILAGTNWGAITDVTVSGEVHALETEESPNRAYAAGLVALNNGGSISHAHSNANVTTEGRNAGGLVAENSNGGTISFASSTGNTVTTNGALTAGGLVGFNTGATISDSFSTSEVIGGTRTGGLVGHNQGGTIERSYTGLESRVTGAVNVGGLVGLNNNAAIIRDSYTVGESVTGMNNVGGLVGRQSSHDVHGDPRIERTYAVIEVVASAAGAVPGGLVGNQDGDAEVNYSFWENTHFGPPSSEGGLGQPITTMLYQATYTTWDFTTTWSIREGNSTPQLRSIPQD